MANLEERMREGVQYPQLRGLVADWLERASQPAQFVTECIELIHEKISKDPNNCSTEGDANTWVAVFLLLDCLRGVPVAKLRHHRWSVAQTQAAVASADQTQARFTLISGSLATGRATVASAL